MSPDPFRDWLESYKRAWETRDPELAASLFAELAVYQEAPYRDPMRGRATVRAYWEHIPRTQDDIRFHYELLAAAGETGIAHWWASFLRIPSGKRVHLDGVAAVTLDGEGKCRLFREWWHKRET
jgi:ketosteroid isomerase-like protein